MRGKGILYTGIGATLVAAIAAFYLTATKPSREANIFQKLSGLDRQVYLQKPKKERARIIYFIHEHGTHLEDKFLNPESGSDPNKGAYAYLDKDGNVAYFCWDGLYAEPVEGITAKLGEGLRDLAKGLNVNGNDLDAALEYLNGAHSLAKGAAYVGLRKVDSPNTEGLRRVSLKGLCYQSEIRRELVEIATANRVY